MSNPQSRRPFSAERRAGLPAGGNGRAFSADTAAPTGDVAALVSEIAALRSEMAAMRTQMESGVKPTPAAPSTDGSEIVAVQIEIAQLVKSIAKAKAEIAAIKHPMSEGDRLLDASNELDAIVQATEMATHNILEAAENIEKEAANLAGLCHEDQDVIASTERIVGQVVRVLEASNFQDITGQRINKVVQTVRFIEQRVLAMIDIWGVEAFEALPLPISGGAGGTDDDLLNGPQLENQGISQADIDALFD